MPNMYREKVCPKCSKKHRKRGPFCSQSCSSKDRPASENVKNALRKTAIEYNRTPEGIAQQKLFNSGLVSDDFAVDIPTLDPDLADYKDYNKAEDW
jgi:hypothetical protein